MLSVIRKGIAMAKNYEQKSMWLVHYGNSSINKALFDTKQEAESFVK